MMPFAANGRIAFDKFEGSIEITQEQYAEALEGVQSGLEVTIDGGFKVVAPVLPPTPPPPPEQIEHKALAQRDQLLAQAAIRVAPLQYAVDRGDATSEERGRLSAWRDYCIELNRIEQQVGFPVNIEWPALP